MLKSLGTEFKVGLFAIVALVTLGYMFFVLSPQAFEKKDYTPYYTKLTNAAGIVVKTQVKTSGVTVGRVTTVGLEGDSTRVNLEIEKGVHIPVGSKIEIRSVGLLGDKHLEVIRPADAGEYIAKSAIIPQSEDGMDLENLINLAGNIAKDIKKVTGTLADVIGTKKGEQSIQNIVENIEGFTADLKASTNTLKHVIGDREPDLQDIVTNVRDGIRDLRAAAVQVRGMASPENKERLDKILAKLDDTMSDAKGAAKNINLISEKVEKGEGTIGKLVNDDSALTDLQGAIKDIRKVLAPATRLEVDFDYHGEFRRDQSSQHYVNVLFKTRPDRYYLLGLTDTTYDTDLQTIKTEPSSPGGTTIYQTDKKRYAIRFNAQVAKRWYWFTARAGIFESTGGIGSDMHFWGDRIRLTAEAFDWDLENKRVRRTAHFKGYASVLFYNHISALIGFDDPTKTDKGTGKARKLWMDGMIGAGLDFSDEDLKAVFGTAALLAR